MTQVATADPGNTAERADATPTPTQPTGQTDVPQGEVEEHTRTEDVVQVSENEVITRVDENFRWYPRPDAEVDGTARIHPATAPQPATQPAAPPTAEVVPTTTDQATSAAGDAATEVVATTTPATPPPPPATDTPPAS